VYAKDWYDDNNGDAKKLYWDFNEDGIADDTINNPSYTFVGATPGIDTVIVTLEIENSYGCIVPVYQPVILYTLNTLVGSDTAVCDLNYNLNASLPVGTGTWSQLSGPGTALIDAPNSNTANVSVSAPGTYIFRWSDVVDSCTDSDDIQITFGSPIADFTIPADVCSGEEISFVNQSIAALGYSWDYGDGSAIETATSPVHTYIASTGQDTVFTISLTGCGDSVITHDIAVHGKPSADFANDADEGCSPLTVNFTNLTTGLSTYNWNYGDGSATETIANPVHTFTVPDGQDTVYTVTLTATNSYGCDSLVTKAITVYGKPISSFTSDMIDGCSPLAVNFVNNSVGAISYQWDFDGDGITDNSSINPGHTFTGNSAGLSTFPVTLIAENTLGCSDTSSSVISVYNMSIDAGEDTTVCGLEYRLDASSIASGTGMWSLVSCSCNVIFDDQSSNTATVTVDGPGTCVFRWENTTPYCTKSDEVEVTFIQRAVADFTVPSEICLPGSVSPLNLSSGASGYLWDFGDGSANETVASPDRFHRT
jgi:PKD repeat protein